MKRSAEPQPQCFWQARDSLKDLLTLGRLENQVDAIASGGCNANNAWAATASALIDRTADYLNNSANRLSIVACNCRDPKRLAAEAAGRLKARPWCRAQPPQSRIAPGGVVRRL
ncbi:MAG: hypothetical protein IPO09_22420 [Anaeromyxobacter sp.]|nr:hypothetical protein [Anaeromyxobacter sp.]